MHEAPSLTPPPLLSMNFEPIAVRSYVHALPNPAHCADFHPCPFGRCFFFPLSVHGQFPSCSSMHPSCAPSLAPPPRKCPAYECIGEKEEEKPRIHGGVRMPNVTDPLSVSPFQLPIFRFYPCEEKVKMNKVKESLSLIHRRWEKKMERGSEWEWSFK
ncbi:hypothetical protein IE53DRAFT_233233 [Violaceomyces palustris]|uniref:Uncharacterized protein n=1 Tax=Violaceomyces palustris TaxID=1673888 RepID=A0ACD0NPK7_9BASI|nr:hypothetical protein IE53DRAFT_233233 [Violaceomyces palustris]